MKSETTTNQTNWQELLNKAVNEPGMVSKCYSKFWNYSLGNQLLAYTQMASRDIPIGPIASFMSWKELGRFVKKGEKAIQLCMPISCKAKEKDEKGEETERHFTRFIFKNNWFALSQTEGSEYQAPEIPGWKREVALMALNLTEVPFESMSGNSQGYALPGGKIAINPVAEMPHKTTFHEMAHCLLGHTEERGIMADDDLTPRSLREAEAESVAMLCCESLGLAGSEYSRGYIQNWLEGAEIPEKSAQKIFHTADLILRAGRIQLKENSNDNQ